MSDISKLFALDPLKLTDADIDAITARQREAQAQYELGVKPTSKAATATKKTKTGDKLLDELGLK
jgi:hypothetical protein